MKHQILISVGSNINKETNTCKGLDALKQYFGDLELSTVFESESVGFTGDNFYNLVVKAFTSEPIESVCKILKTIEDNNGRTREKKFSNRTLDLDLLTYDDMVCHQPVVLPREEIEYNAFVLQPMAELVPDETHPSSGKTYRQLWEEYKLTPKYQQQSLWPTSLHWSA